VQKGVDLYQVQRLLGHKSNAISKRYAHLHLSSEYLREAIDKLDSTNLAQSQENDTESIGNG
jgi:site-specific recombinase XerD